ncbi:hypothetical protein AB5J56_21585 [Streptomyces sp. R21]|uniref:Secreted protein n=1 Tax=Streptomyces sp. R21 TaxID=3238627 RepID=A0AB39PBC0_9ACTN
MKKRMLRSVLATGVVAAALAFGVAGPLDVGWQITSGTTQSAVAHTDGTQDVGWQVVAQDVGWQVVSGDGAQDVGWQAAADADA